MSDLDAIAGVAHEPAAAPTGVVLLTHGAGGSRESPLLIRICDEWARRGWLAVRYNLPYRRRRPKGPPSGSAAGDRDGIVEALNLAGTLTDGHPEVVHVGVGENQELLGGESLYHHLRSLLGRHGGVAEVCDVRIVGQQHVGLDSHRAKARDADAAIAIMNRQPLRK